MPEESRWGNPEQYVGKTVVEVRVEKLLTGEDRLVIVFADTENYLDIRAEELFY